MRAPTRRYSACSTGWRGSQWRLNRGVEGVETAQRALAILPDERRTAASAPRCSPGLPGPARYAGAFAMRSGTGDRRSGPLSPRPIVAREAEVLNTLGMTQIALGHVDEGFIDCGVRSRSRAQTDDIEGSATRTANLADMLNVAGRTHEALGLRRRAWLRSRRRLSRSYDWMTLTISQLAFEAGDWELAQANLTPPSQLIGLQLIFRQLREAELALGEGEEEIADAG